MLSKEEVDKVRSAASIIRTESRRYYDTYKHNNDTGAAKINAKAVLAYERFHELDKIANELDVIADGNL